MPVLAIDGLAASGKGTLGKRLADHFGFAYLNTGLLYRAVALEALDTATVLDDGKALAALAHALDSDKLDEQVLAQETYGRVASKIATQPLLREALLSFQRTFAMRDEGAVLDGRDIGTVVCPDAEAKLFISAEVETRARRRLLQEKKTLSPDMIAEAVAHLKARDQQDKERKAAPMVAADDALLLDTTELTIEEAVNAALELIKGRF